MGLVYCPFEPPLGLLHSLKKCVSTLDVSVRGGINCTFDDNRAFRLIKVDLKLASFVFVGLGKGYDVFAFPPFTVLTM